MEKTKGQLNGEQKIEITDNDELSGLTKREYISIKAMQGYIVQRNAQNDMDRIKIVDWSVKMADTLLEELSKKRE